MQTKALLHEQQEGEKEQAVQLKERTIVGRQERSSRHTVQLNHEAVSSKDATSQDFAFNSMAQMKTSSLILGTANVDISNEEGKKFTTRALLDFGSQSNFITKELCDAIGCRIQKERIPIKVTEEQLSHQLKQFWELEEVTSKSILTKEERACEEHFVTHHKQEANRRFVLYAVRCIQELAKNNEHKFSNTARVVMTDFYVDDVLTGVATIEEARNLQAELTNLFEEGQFKLRKWQSNEIAALPRGSCTSAKLILQRLWCLQLGWDERLSQPEEQRWIQLFSQLSTLNNLHIPRKVTTFNEFVELQLHGELLRRCFRHMSERLMRPRR
ncbi:hypothetical protein Trydic_g11723 [Trypoxylus dichotomus]